MKEESLYEPELLLQRHIDSTARSAGFRDEIDAATYVYFTKTQWAKEAKSFLAWRDAIWEWFDNEKRAAISGGRAVPNFDEFAAHVLFRSLQSPANKPFFGTSLFSQS